MLYRVRKYGVFLKLHFEKNKIIFLIKIISYICNNVHIHRPLKRSRLQRTTHIHIRFEALQLRLK